jgi:hypothetical protein
MHPQCYIRQGLAAQGETTYLFWFFVIPCVCKTVGNRIVSTPHNLWAFGTSTFTKTNTWYIRVLMDFAYLQLDLLGNRELVIYHCLPLLSIHPYPLMIHGYPWIIRGYLLMLHAWICMLMMMVIHGSSVIHGHPWTISGIYGLGCNLSYANMIW